MLASQAHNVYIISASFWEVLAPVLALVLGTVVGSLTSLWVVMGKHLMDWRDHHR